MIEAKEIEKQKLNDRADINQILTLNVNDTFLCDAINMLTRSKKEQDGGEESEQSQMKLIKKINQKIAT
jgi:hypothetical protein